VAEGRRIGVVKEELPEYICTLYPVSNALGLFLPILNRG